MKTIALIGNKGGGGKSLSSILLASEAARRDMSVALVDLDPQGTCEDWASGQEDMADKPKVKRLPDTQLTAAAGALRSSGCDLLVIDTAPHTEKASVAAARLADLIVIPARPTRADLRAIRFTVDMLKASGSLAKAHVLLNAVSPQGDEASQASEGIRRAYGLPTLEATLGHRKAYQQALGVGSDPIGWAHGKAADEQRALVDEVFRLLRIGGEA